MKQSPKKLVVFLLAAVLIAVVINLIPNTQHLSKEQALADLHIDELRVVRKESKVLDAFITPQKILYVQVIDDGTRRDGYAAYLCELLRGLNSKVKRTFEL